MSLEDVKLYIMYQKYKLGTIVVDHIRLAIAASVV
jgi:hypothetical protein